MTTVAGSSRTRRRPRSHSFAARDALDRSLGYAIELLLALVLIFSPLAFGSVEYWSQYWMMIGVGLAMFCLAFRWIAYPTSCRPTFTFAYVPIVLFLALALLQWTPLPASVVGSLSASSAGAWDRVAQLLPGESVGRTLSVYPLATERQFRLLMLVCAVFFIVLNHYRERDQIIRLLTAIVIAGVLCGLIAISQNLTDDRTPWMGVVAPHPDSGPFMNHSHFGQYMNLCIGAALALLLVGLKRQIGDSTMSFRSLKHHLFRKSSLSLLFPLVFIVSAPILVALSMTRGGVLSIVIAGGITGIILGVTQSGRGKRSLIAVLAFLIFLVSLKFGFDAVYDRMATLRNVEDTGGGIRLQMVRDMVPMLKDFPLFGVGLGAFAHVFPSYDTASERAYATHAENEYAQLAVEAGLLGIALAFGFLIFVGVHTYHAIRHGRRSIHAGSIGLMFGVLAMLIHSLSDFGQHVPAIACVTATLTALLIRLGLDAREDRRAAVVDAEVPRSSGTKRSLVGVGAVAFAVGWLWLIGRTGAETDAEALWMEARRNYTEMERRGLADASDGEFILALKSMARASEIMPGDADYRYGLNVTRYQSISQYDRQLTAAFLRRIADECLNISKVAPYFGPSITFTGQVRLFDLGDTAAEALIRRGFELARYSQEASFAVASLDARDGRWESCMENLRHAIELGVRRIDAADLLVRFDRVDLALQLVDRSRPDMIQLADLLDRTGKAEQGRTLRDQATLLLVAEANQPDAPPDAMVQLAEAYIRERQYDDAIPLIRRALAVRYNRGDWRTTLIGALRAQGNIDEALREARTHLRLNPGDAKAKSLLEELVTAPTTQLTRPR